MRRCELLLVSCVLAAACSDAAPPRVGVVMSAIPRQAVHLAAAEQDADDPGYFEAVLGQSDGTAEGAIEQANRFVADRRVIAVIGHSNSAASIAASQIYNAAGIVQIAPTTTAPVYSEAGPFSFRLVPSDTAQAAYLRMVQQHHWPTAQRIAVVHVNDDYGRGLFRELRPLLDSAVYEGMYSDDTELDGLVQISDRIIAHRPDLLYWLGRPRALAVILPSLRKALPRMTIICGDACDQAAVYRNEGGTFDGINFVRFTDPSSADSALREFQKRYMSLTGEIASSEALLTYDAVALVRAAIRDGVGTPEELRRWLESLGSKRPAFAGVSGAISFDSSGTANRRYMLAQVHRDGVHPAEHTGMYQ